MGCREPMVCDDFGDPLRCGHSMGCGDPMAGSVGWSEPMGSGDFSQMWHVSLSSPWTHCIQRRVVRFEFFAVYARRFLQLEFDLLSGGLSPRRHCFDLRRCASKRRKRDVCVGRAGLPQKMAPCSTATLQCRSRDRECAAGLALLDPAQRVLLELVGGVRPAGRGRECQRHRATRPAPWRFGVHIVYLCVWVSDREGRRVPPRLCRGPPSALIEASRTDATRRGPLKRYSSGNVVSFRVPLDPP